MCHRRSDNTPNTHFWWIHWNPYCKEHFIDLKRGVTVYFPRLKLFSAMEPRMEWGMFSLSVIMICWSNIMTENRRYEQTNWTNQHVNDALQFSEGSFNGFHPNCYVINWILIFYIFLTYTMYTVGKNNGGTLNCYKQLKHSSFASATLWVAACVHTTIPLDSSRLIS